MHVTLPTKSFSSLLSRTKPAISKRATLPILHCMKLEAKDGAVLATATDLDCTIHAKANGDGTHVEAEGSIAVSHEVLSDLMSVWPENDELTLSVQDAELKVSTAGREFSILTLPADEYPGEPDMVSAEVEFTADISSALRMARVAVEDNAVNLILTGILFDARDRLRLVATDTHRLIVCETNVYTKLDKPVSFIVPPRQVAAFVKPGDATWSFSANSLTITQDDATLRTRIIGGQFPAYGKVVPTPERTYIVDRAELKRTLEGLRVIAQSNSDKLILKFEGSMLAINAESQEVGQGNVHHIAVEGPGDSLEIAFNVRYLLDYIGVCTGERISMGFGGPLNPGLFTDPDNDGHKYICMPMQV